MSTVFLNVPFSQKDQAKALGARWDATARKWAVSDDVDLSPFSQWLHAGTSSNAASTPSSSPPSTTVSARMSQAPWLQEQEDPSTSAGANDAAQFVGQTARAELLSTLEASQEVNPEGVASVTLSSLMLGMRRIVEVASVQVWVRAELANVSIKNGMAYLELTERDEQGNLIAQVKASMWKGVATKALARFTKETGSELRAGIKVLVQARPQMHEKFGFSLQVSDIDPSYTLGDLEAKLTAIRARLQLEGIYEAQKALNPPIDFFRVLVIAPEGAAGLGDFLREASIINDFGVCAFDVVHATFQGDRAAAGIAELLQDSLELAQETGTHYDAVAIIRGGGSPTDLAYLNEYSLARAICLSPVPVFTGIGHERDNTILDEVSFERFDTPSKVVGGIWAHIQNRANYCAGAIETIRSRCELLVAKASQRVQENKVNVRTRAFSLVATASKETATLKSEVRTLAFARVSQASQVTKALEAEVVSGARGRVALVRERMAGNEAAIQAKALAMLGLAKANVVHHMGTVEKASEHVVRNARRAYQGLLREVLAQGPQRVLGRGFAYLKDAGGKVVSKAHAVKAGDLLEVVMADGTLKVAAQ